MSSSPSIIYTWTDEAPQLATHAFLPVVRAFAGATVHDFFNLLSVAVFFPLEIRFHVIEKLAIKLTGAFTHVGGAKFASPLKLATEPVINSLKHAAVDGLGLSPRAAGIVLGATAGSMLAGAEPHIRRWLGVALLPQAGVALGMALVATERFPVRAHELLPVAIAATALFELVGPIFTRRAIRLAARDAAAGD